MRFISDVLMIVDEVDCFFNHFFNENCRLMTEISNRSMHILLHKQPIGNHLIEQFHTNLLVFFCGLKLSWLVLLDAVSYFVFHLHHPRLIIFAFLLLFLIFSIHYYHYHPASLVIVASDTTLASVSP